MATVRIYDAEQSKEVTVEKIEKTDAEWKKLLTAGQYEITTKKGTEAPGTCTFDCEYPAINQAHCNRPF